MNLRPDVLIVPECEHPKKLRAAGIDQHTLFSESWFNLNADHCAWVGKNDDKGLAVFTFGKYTLGTLACDLTNGPIWCIPLHVRNNGIAAFDLIAVWSFYNADSRNRHGNPMVHALEDFAPVLSAEHLVVAGDFNSPINFNEKGPSGFKTTNRELEARGLVNAYTSSTGELLGQASQPTFYLYYGMKFMHHIDHVYVPKTWTNGIRVTCGDYETWVKSEARHRSDHVPVIVDVQDQVLDVGKKVS